jgi:hypothetical protein
MAACPGGAELEANRVSPSLTQLAGEGARVLLLNATDSFAEASDWVRKYAPTLPAGVLVERQGSLNSLAVVSLPTIVLLDEKGREVERWRGPTELSVLRKTWQDIQNAEYAGSIFEARRRGATT